MHVAPVRAIVGSECVVGPAPVRSPILRNLSSRRSGRGHVIEEVGSFLEAVLPVDVIAQRPFACVTAVTME